MAEKETYKIICIVLVSILAILLIGFFALGIELTKIQSELAEEKAHKQELAELFVFQVEMTDWVIKNQNLSFTEQLNAFSYYKLTQEVDESK